MGILDNITGWGPLTRRQEQQLYGLVASELENGFKEKGLWLKALAESGGDESRAISKYVKLRVQSLADESELRRYATNTQNQQTHEKSTSSISGALDKPLNQNNHTSSSQRKKRKSFSQMLVDVFLYLIFICLAAIGTAIVIALSANM
jgi:hypothetical protein